MRFAIALALASLLLTSPAVFACKCRPPAPPKDALAESFAVFTGKVTSVEKAGEFQIAVTLKVRGVWKGVKDKEVTLYTANHSAACGVEFKEGVEYLVYADQQKNGDRVALSTNSCTRTRSLDNAAEDLKELGAGVKMD
jgi:hypothetical protein